MKTLNQKSLLGRLVYFSYVENKLRKFAVQHITQLL